MEAALSNRAPNPIHATQRRKVFSASFRHTTLPCLSAPISSAVNPNSASTSLVCSPTFGGRAAILLGVHDSVTGWPTMRI